MFAYLSFILNRIFRTSQHSPAHQVLYSLIICRWMKSRNFDFILIRKSNIKLTRLNILNIFPKNYFVSFDFYHDKYSIGVNYLSFDIHSLAYLDRLNKEYVLEMFKIDLWISDKLFSCYPGSLNHFSHQESTEYFIVHVSILWLH